MLTQQIETQTEQVKIASWLNFAEINFLKVLARATEGKAFIFTKVKLNDILLRIESIDDMGELDFGDKTFDFVLCDKQDLSVICVIELDSRSHQAQSQCAEESYEALCADFAIPLLEVPARCGYNVAELARYISCYID